MGPGVMSELASESVSTVRGSERPGRYVIGVDLGTGGVKVALATVRGEILGHEAEKTATAQ